jgi:hypothetical protein
VAEAPTEAIEGYRDVNVGVRVYAQDEECLFACVDGQRIHRSLLSLEIPALCSDAL